MIISRRRLDFIVHRQRDDPCIRVEVEGLSRRRAARPDPAGTTTTTPCRRCLWSLRRPQMLDLQHLSGLSLGHLPMPRHGADRGSHVLRRGVEMGCPCPTGLCTGRFLDIYVRGRAMYDVNIKLLRLSRHHRLSRKHSHRYLGSISSWSWPPEPVSIG